MSQNLKKKSNLSKISKISKISKKNACSQFPCPASRDKKCSVWVIKSLSMLCTPCLIVLLALFFISLFFVLFTNRTRCLMIGRSIPTNFRAVVFAITVEVSYMAYKIKDWSVIVYHSTVGSNRQQDVLKRSPSKSIKVRQYPSKSFKVH
jgi:hypothetical protein